MSRVLEKPRKATELHKEGTVKISVVIPLLNEEENIEILHQRLKAILNRIGEPYEIICVDDGSTDGTFELLSSLHQKDQHLKIIKLRKNFGQTAALAAGFDYSHGEYIIAMDGDLQYHPEDIPFMLEKAREGYDIVNGWRKGRNDGFLRKVPSAVANWLIAKLNKIPIHDFGSTFKVYRKEVVKSITLYGELHRFIPVIACEKGFSIIEVPVRHSLRTRGKSNYNLSRTKVVFFDLIRLAFLSSYFSRPLHIFGGMGLFCTITGFGLGVYISLMKFLNGVSADRPLTLVAVLLILVGLQFFSTGLMGEMNVRIFHERQDQSPYTISKIVE